MKGLYFNFVMMIWLFFTGSCDNANNGTLDKAPIAIPENVKNEINYVFANGKEKVVVYFLSKKDCAECTVSKIALWKNYSTLINSSNIGLVLITNDGKGLKDLSRMNYLGVDLFRILDKDNNFFQADGQVKTNIPTAFVLNKDFTMLMEGNPIESSASFDSFKEIITSD